MFRKCFLLLMALVVVAVPGLAAEAYVLPFEEGVMHSFELLPGGDVLQAGSYVGRMTEDGARAIGTVSRIKPDGTEVWALDIAYRSDVAGQPLVKLDEGRYLIGEGYEDGRHTQVFLLDAQTGYVRDVEKAPYQDYVPTDGGILSYDQLSVEGAIRLRWYDLDLNEQRALDLPWENPQKLSFQLVSAQETLYTLQENVYEEGPRVLTGLTEAGETLFTTELDIPKEEGLYLLGDDGESGVYVLHVGGYDSQDGLNATALRIGPDGARRWEVDLPLDALTASGWGYDLTEEGLRTFWKDEGRVTLITLASDGSLTQGPAYRLPADAYAHIYVAGIVPDDAGRLWLCYHVEREEEGGSSYRPYVVALDSLDLAE